MKKSLLVSAMAAAMVLSTSMVMAAPGDITVDGSVAYQYRTNSGAAGGTVIGNDNSKKGSRTTILVNGNAQLSDEWSFYTRFAAESATIGKDFKGAAYPANTQSVAGLDQFGFKYKAGDSTATVGRQAVFLGSTGLLYDTTGYLGKHYFADGVTFASKSGDFSYNLVAAQEDTCYDVVSASKNKIYAGHVDYAATDKLTIGATYGQYKYGHTGDAAAVSQSVGFVHNANNSDLDSLKNSFNFTAVNASYNFGAVTLNAEYAKTGLSSYNHSYAYGINYKFSDADNLSVYYYKAEQFGDVNGNTTFDPNEKGYYYTYSHVFNKALSASLFYKDSKILNTTVGASSTSHSGDKDQSLRATLTYKF